MPRRTSAIIFCLMLVAGVLLRAGNLARQPFWEDEAESSINALTILQHGYPSDHYLGIPVFENTLVREWPANPEYEFKDISYSDRGVAIYHGWLPLYAIAASFAVARISPEAPPTDIHVRYTAAQNRRRTVVARLPAMIFSLLFITAAFFAGKVLYGSEAAWTAALLGTLHPTAIDISCQARYYSAEVAFSTLCCLLVWLMHTRSRWQDYLLGSLAFVFLFHVHLLAFLSAFLILALLIPFQLRHGVGRLKKLFVFGMIVAAGTVPWLFVTGFLRQQRFVPPAWPLVRPSDLLTIISDRKVLFVLYVVAAALIGSRRYYQSRFPRVGESVRVCQSAFLFLSLWVTVSYLIFVFLVPAVSLSWSRYYYIFWGPGVILLALVIGALSRPMSAKRSVGMAILILSTIYGFNGFRIGDLNLARSPASWTGIDRVVSNIGDLHLAADTRLYATPNDHLILTFYTGLPFQSIAPVRRDFLQSYLGPILIAERHTSLQSLLNPDPVDPLHLQELATRAATKLLPEEAIRLSESLHSRPVRESLSKVVHDVDPPLDPVPIFAQGAYQQFRGGQERAIDPNAGLETIPVFRGFRLKAWDEWWQVYFYRFAGVDRHTGPNLNYLPLLPKATAFVVSESPWVLYLIPRKR